MGSIILRPTSDGYMYNPTMVGNNPQYTGGTTFFGCTSESTPDDDTSYASLIATTSNNTPGYTNYFTLGFSGASNIEKLKSVTGISVTIRYKELTNGGNLLSCAGGNGAVPTTSEAYSNKTFITILDPVPVTTTYVTITANLPVSFITASAASRTINPFYICFSIGLKPNDSKSNPQFCVTQIYATLTYEEVKMTVYCKINGVWHLCSSMYVKIDGTWRSVSDLKSKVNSTWV